MTLDSFKVVNTPSVVDSSMAPSSKPYIFGSIIDVSTVANVIDYRVASFEDYSINWTDFSFDYLAEE